MMKTKKIKRRNTEAQDLHSPKYHQRIVSSKKKLGVKQIAADYDDWYFENDRMESPYDRLPCDVEPSEGSRS